MRIKNTVNPLQIRPLYFIYQINQPLQGLRHTLVNKDTWCRSGQRQDGTCRRVTRSGESAPHPFKTTSLMAFLSSHWHKARGMPFLIKVKLGA